MLLELVPLSRLTLLVAEAGSDKSSVLRSKVMPLLQQRSSGSAKEIPVLFDWWKKAPLVVLNARTDEALARVVGDAAYAIGDHGDGLCARLATRQKVFDCTFTIILDRFEEYLEAPADKPDVRDFEAQLVEAVNSRIVRANFVLSLDELAVPQLARLRERIPGLGDERVRLSRVPDGPTAPAKADSAELAGQLVGSRAALLVGAEPARGLYDHTAPVFEHPEITGVHDELRHDAVPTQPGASALPSSQELAPDHSDDLKREIARTPEAIMPSAMVPERHEEATAATAVESEVPTAARATETRPQSRYTRASVVIVVVVAILSSVALLATRRSAAPASDAAELPPQTLAAENDLRAEGHVVEQPGEAPLDAQEAHRSAPYRGEVPDPGVPSRGDAPASFELRKPSPGAANEPSQSEVVIEKSTTPALPTASSSAAERGPVLAPQAASPLLYIHVGGDAQRAYAESIIKPLARHGIRVSGIRIVSVGPPASDLRYFHSADRGEAVRINRALDLVGKPAQRLNYVQGFEDQKARSQYELWLPATL